MQSIETSKRKVVSGHSWEWRDENPTIRAHWKSTSGNLVLIFPPTPTDDSWYINVGDEEFAEIRGIHAEGRAFSVGELYTRQDRTRK